MTVGADDGATTQQQQQQQQQRQQPAATGSCWCGSLGNVIVHFVCVQCSPP
mgnify:CR=1 FL=1